MQGILFEDKDVLVCVKPAGMAVQSAAIGQPDMESRLRSYLAADSTDRIPYIGIVHRLDQPVEGVLVFAKNKKAAAALQKQMSADTTHKNYLAVLEKEIPVCGEVELTHYLKKEKNISIVSSKADKNAKKAVLTYQICAAKEGKSLALIRLKTGRFHQIRCQLSAIGLPIAGDVKYHAQKGGGRTIALCACRLVFTHPLNKKTMTFTYKPEQENFSVFSKEIEDILEVF